MKIRSILLSIALLLPAAATLTVAQPSQAQPSADEQKMAEAIISATDLAMKLRAAAEFIKKYPMSSFRSRIANALVDQVSNVTDTTQKVALAQSYETIFTDPAEENLLMPVLIDALSQAKRPAEAFTRGGEFLTRNPDYLPVLVQLLALGTAEAKAKNPKFVTQSLQYGAHAIQLVETDKKPAWLDDAAWTKYKSETLPGLYQSMGLLNLVKGDKTQARASYGKASELAPTDAFNFVMLAGIINEEYQTSAKQYQGLPAGPAKDEELKKAQALMDAAIDAYAHAVAVAEGNATLQPVRQQYLQDLEAYYKYRHNNSTAGMQELINKYKVTPNRP
jgi:hypothetical protein